MKMDFVREQFGLVSSTKCPQPTVLVSSAVLHLKITSRFWLESSFCIRINPFGIGVNASAVVLTQAKVIDTRILLRAALDLIQGRTFLGVVGFQESGFS